jgi:hypothetical protein
MAISDKDRDLLWSAVYTIVMAYEHGAVSLDEAKDVVEVICTGTAVLPGPDED